MEEKGDIVYSESVSEILGTPPAAVLRYSTAVIFLILVVVVILSSVISYSDIITAKAEITTVNPPATLNSKITSRIEKLFIKDRDTIVKNQILAVLNSPVDVSEYFILKSFLGSTAYRDISKAEQIPDLYRLGSMQQHYNNLKKSVAELYSGNYDSYYLGSIRAVEAEMAELQNIISKLEKKEQIFDEISWLEGKRFGRINKLNTDSAIMPAEYDAARQDFLKKEGELEQVRLDITAEKIRFHSAESRLNELKLKFSESDIQLKASVDEFFRSLVASVAEWEEKYLLVSPIDGVAVLTKFWSANQSVKEGEPLVSVIPSDPGEIIGRVRLGMRKSGLVKPGNKVNVKLVGYPYLDFGSINGVVLKKSLLPAENEYVVDILFPGGFRTVYGQKIELMQEMEGIAEIVTEKKSLLTKILSPVKYLFNAD